MAVVQKDGATVKMVVPISTPAMTQGKSTISMATGTTAPTTTATAVLKTVYAQSPKVNSLLQSGAQIRIVTPNVDPKTSVAPLSALQTLTTATKIVSSGPNFSGGNLITKKILPKQVASVQLIKKTVGQETKTNSSISANSKDNTKTTDSGSWNLKPINVSAIKNPLQQHMDSVSGQPVTNIDSSKVPGSQTGSKEPEQNIRPTFDLGDNLSESSSSNSQSPKPFTPPLSQGPIPSQVKGSSSLPMRPSDIDLHELQLSGESKAMSQRPSDIDLSAMKLSTTKKETEKKKPRARSTKASKASKSTKAPSSQNNLENLLSSPQGTSQNIGNLPQNIAGAQNKFQSQSQNQFQQGMLPSNQYPGGTGSHSNMQSGFTGGVGSSEGTQNMGNANMTNTMGAQGMDTGSQGSMEARSGGTPGGFMRMMSGEDSQDDDSLLAEFNSNIQNNSSFLSELNLTEADQNFMSQHVFDNNPSNMNQMNMSSNYNNNMGMSGYNSGGNMGYQQPGMNYDSGGMYNNPQNTGYNYPSFGAGPYQGNSYSGNQSSSQRMPHSNSYPGSMYPMPGMMQPGMYGYPPYPYPYPPHMMPPMPYYPPMPMPPQYGQPGQGGSNMSQMNMTMSGDNQMSSGTTGPNSTANNNTL